MWILELLHMQQEYNKSLKQISMKDAIYCSYAKTKMCEHLVDTKDSSLTLSLLHRIIIKETGV